MFQNFKYLSAWLVTYTLNENYGDDDHKIYKLIEKTLKISLASQKARKDLSNNFQKICNQLGLPSRGFDRMVDLYLLHAAVSKAQLPQLITAFTHQHNWFGAPPVESTVLLNKWEDDALKFLPTSLMTPRRAILWDETAWHAGLYARISKNPKEFEPHSPFENIFLDCYHKTQNEVKRSSITTIEKPPPQLNWGTNGLVLRLPSAEKRISIWFDEDAQPLLLKGGEDWQVKQPWPHRLHGIIDGIKFNLNFLCDETRFAIFDMTIGQMLVEKQIMAGSEIEVDTSDALIVARRPFSIAGENAISLCNDCFVYQTTLNIRNKEINFGSQRLVLRTKLRRRLILRGGEIAQGRKGKLFGPTALIHIETGLGTDETRTVRLSSGPQSWLVDVEVTEGSGELSLSHCGLSRISTNPGKLRLELMAPRVGSEEQRSSGIVLDAWIWPSFITRQGLAFQSCLPPTNFLNEQSIHVSALNPDGLYLDANGGYIHATAAFKIDGEVVTFNLPWPDIIIQRHRTDGSTTLMPIGTRIDVGNNDRFSHLCVRCPDHAASLRVGTRTETSPFAFGMTRIIVISDLMVQGQKATVVLQRSNGTEALLFEVVDVFEPTRFDIRPTSRHINEIEVTLSINSTIDAIGIEEENELAQRTFHEISLDHSPSPKAPPEWLDTKHSTSDRREVIMKITQTDAINGLRIGRVFVRTNNPFPNDSWHPLRNTKGDTFTLPLTTNYSLKDAPLDQIKTRFETLNRWLLNGYAPECWMQHGLERHIPPRWRNLGQTIMKRPLDAGLLITASIAPTPEEASPNFVPFFHPIEIDTGLYSATPEAFLSLNNISKNELQAAKEMAKLSHEKLQEGLLHGQALMAFSNCKKEQKIEETLTGFNVVNFFNLFKYMDTDVTAGEFWHGTPLLGPDHLRSAFRRMVERIEEASIFIEDEPEKGNHSKRWNKLYILTRQVWKKTEANRRPQIPKRHVKNDCPMQTDLYIATTLSEFAAASRNGHAQSFLDHLAQSMKWRREDVLASLGFLLHLAPELFFYFLLVWQLAKVRP